MHITKNGATKKVTKGTYDNIYKKMGWVPVNGHVNIQGSKAHVEFMSPSPAKNPPMRESFVQPPEPEPIREETVTDFTNMGYQQLLAYARERGISLGKVRQRDEIIDLLKRETE